MKPSDVRQKSNIELNKLTGELAEEVFRLRVRKNSGQLKQTANIKKTKRDLARVLTVLSENKVKDSKKERK